VIPQVLETAVDANPLLFLPQLLVHSAKSRLLQRRWRRRRTLSKAKLVVDDHLAKLMVRKIRRSKY